MSRSQDTNSLDARPANFDHYLFTGVERRRVDLRDRGGRERRAVKSCEYLVDLRAELGAQQLLDLRPRDLRGVVLQAAQFVGELAGQKVAPRGQELAELDERDIAVLKRQAQRASELSPAVVGLQL